MAPVAGRPFLAFIMDVLASQGIRRAIVATGYKGTSISAAFGVRWGGMELIYSHEDSPLGTGGAIAKAAALIEGQSFFVLNGDTYLGLDYSAFGEFVRGQDARLGIALAEVPDVARYGAVEVEGNRIAGFREKGLAGPGFINAGVYWVDKGLFPADAQVSQFSFETEILVPLVRAEAIAGFTHTRGFIDIGIPEDYSRAQSELSGLGNK